MSEPVMIWMAGIGVFGIPLAQWFIAHPKCRYCGTRVKLISESGSMTVAKCPACAQE